jgi:hypothetical protein
MKARLNVTEAECLCHSRRKLQAISALRNAGIDPSIYGLHKDYRVPGVRGKVYLAQHPTGNLCHFSKLAAIHAYTAEHLAWETQPRLAWNERRQAPAKGPPSRTVCAWQECALHAEGPVDSQSFRRGHEFV